MSRIGRMPIAIPAGVTVDIAENNQVTVKGPKGTLERVLPAEMAITKEPVKRSGLHEVSKGDFVFNGMVVEIKYLTKKTKASKDLKGTLATHYLIGFNNGNEIELRLIAKSDLVVRQDNRIAYQDNINKGVRL